MADNESPFQSGSGNESGSDGSGYEGWGYEGPPPTVAPATPAFDAPPPPPYPAFDAPPPAYPAAPSYGPGYQGYQPQYLPGPYPVYPTPQSNGLAVAAMICGICGFFCVTPFAAIGLGIGGLQQAKRTGVGRAMSIWGICLGAAWLLLSVGFVVIAVLSLSD